MSWHKVGSEKVRESHFPWSKERNAENDDKNKVVRFETKPDSRANEEMKNLIQQAEISNDIDAPFPFLQLFSSRNYYGLSLSDESFQG